MNEDIREKVQRCSLPNESGCWIWQRGWARATGYSRVRAFGRTTSGHRASYQAFIGPIPAGMTIDHLCRVRLCVNPAHLEAVTSRTNTLRAPETLAARNVAKSHCPQGHPYDEFNTYSKPSGARDCRSCRREAVRRYRARVTAPTVPAEATR